MPRLTRRSAAAAAAAAEAAAELEKKNLSEAKVEAERTENATQTPVATENDSETQTEVTIAKDTTGLSSNEKEKGGSKDKDGDENMEDIIDSAEIQSKETNEQQSINYEGDEDLLTESDRLADLFAMFLSDNDTENDTSMSIPARHLSMITKELGIYNYYYYKDGREKESMKNVWKNLDPNQTQRIDFVAFDEFMPQMISEAKRMKNPETIEKTQEEETQLKSQQRIQETNKEKEKENRDLNEKYSNKPTYKSKESKKTRQPLETQKSPTKIRLTHYERAQALKDFMLFTNGEDRNITLDDLMRVSQLVKDDEPMTQSDFLDMLQLHVPGSHSEKPEISIQDFENIMKMAGLL